MSDIRDNKSADRANNPLTDKACRLLMLKLLRFDVQQLAKIDGQLVHGRSCFAMSIEDSSFRLSLFFFQALEGLLLSPADAPHKIVPISARTIFTILCKICIFNKRYHQFPCAFLFLVRYFSLLMKYRVNNGNNDGHPCSVALFRNYIFCA